MLPFIKSNSGRYTVVAKNRSCDFGPDHPAYIGLVESMQVNDEDEFVRLYDRTQLIDDFYHGLVNIRDGVLYYRDQECDPYISNMTLSMIQDGFDYVPMCRFIERLYKNPSNNSITQLFRFMSDNNMPINEDGYVIGYKYVHIYNGDDILDVAGNVITKGDYVDSYSQKTHRYNVGDVAEMPRRKVCDDYSVCCSTGLHVGSPRYASSYRDAVIVAVDPADVVSVPKGESHKLRACKIKILAKYENTFEKVLAPVPYETLENLEDEDDEDWDECECGSGLEVDADGSCDDCWSEDEDFDDEDLESDWRVQMIDKYFAVGSDGFIALKDIMGSDESIEQAARISYGKGTRKKSETRGLLRYLKRNQHTSPFEQAELQFHVRVPMHIWRQWIRHRTANVNEYSTRYSEAIDSYETTNPDTWRLQSGVNKQGSDGYLRERSDDILHLLYPIIAVEDSDPNFYSEASPGAILSVEEQKFHEKAQALYQQRIDMGVAREQARKDLPLSTYTEAFWKCDLHNLMHFCSLRCDSHAQKEIRDYANVVAGIIKEQFPLSYEAWYDYQFQSVNFTRLDRIVLNYHISISQANIDPEVINGMGKDTETFAKKQGMSQREIDEFWIKIKPPTEVSLDLSNHPIYGVEK